MATVMSVAASCGITREALSAALDGEDLGITPRELADHLVDCRHCRRWHVSAGAVHRQSQLVAAPPMRDLSGQILAATVGAAPRRVRTGRLRRGARRWVAANTGLLRALLGAVALTQLAYSIPMLVLGHDRMAPLHISHEVGSFQAALAAGFGYVALRPVLARGMRPLVGVVCLLLVATALIDIVMGHTTAQMEIPHLLPVLGWLLMGPLARLDPLPAPGPVLAARPGATGRVVVLGEDTPLEGWAASEAPSRGAASATG